MHFLEEKILADGVIKPGNILKVDNFLNHQIDMMRQIAYEFKRRFNLHSRQLPNELNINC